MTWKLIRQLVLTVFTVLTITSCQKDDATGENNTGSLTFNAILNDTLNENSQTRQQAPGTEVPDCSEAAPAYVDIVATGSENIGSIAAPFRVDLVAEGSTYITAENDELTGLPVGDYQLIYFVVYDAENNPIWIAPTSDNFSEFVSEPLPLDFSVEAGTDNEVNVEVLCFENRILNEFGNLYFSLDPHRAIEFCIAGNTCGEGAADFNVNVYLGADNTGSILYMDYNTTPGEALCMALPDLDGEDQYYFEIIMGGNIIREGVITDADVKALHDGENNISPYIFYEGSACTGADNPDLFYAGGETGGGDTGETAGTFDIPYQETFETATAESVLTDFGYSTENLPGQTVPGPGAAGIVQNTFPSVDDETVTADSWGIQYGYVNNNAETSTGLVDNIVRTSAFTAAAGDYTLTYDVSFVKKLDNHSVEVYYSEDSEGSFSNGTWTMIDAVSQADLEAAGVGRQEFQRRTASISTTGNFYMAFRFKADIVADGDGTRWRIDNVTVDTDGSGGGDTGGTFTDYVETFEDFDESATYDPPYLESKGFEQYQFTTFAEENNILFEPETNGKYPSLEDVTVEGGSGFQMTYFAETNSTEPGDGVFGDFNVVLVSPGQENADGDFTINIDARRFFSETSGTVTWYWTNNYTPGEGFTEANWNSLGSDDAQDLNDRGSFARKSFNIPSSSGTLYFAIRVEGTTDDGGTPDTTKDGNYRFRVRFDNLQITQN